MKMRLEWSERHKENFDVARKPGKVTKEEVDDGPSWSRTALPTVFWKTMEEGTTIGWKGGRA